jgi:hypothetical protein
LGPRVLVPRVLPPGIRSRVDKSHRRINRGVEEERGVVGVVSVDVVVIFIATVIEHSCILDLQLHVKINPAAGCTGRGDREEEREGYASKCANRTICLHL